MTALEQSTAGAADAQARAYSGRFVVRIAPSLHRDLVRCARAEGVSLNHFAAVALSRAVGQRDRGEATRSAQR
jgi:predicted HicB family RNase H-like nuclease